MFALLPRRRKAMHLQSSSLPVYLALALAVVAAITSAPTAGHDIGHKLLWALATQAAADDAVSYQDELQALGLP
jgi:hypothetical protein